MAMVNKELKKGDPEDKILRSKSCEIFNVHTPSATISNSTKSTPQSQRSMITKQTSKTKQPTETKSFKKGIQKTRSFKSYETFNVHTPSFNVNFPKFEKRPSITVMEI